MPRPAIREPQTPLLLGHRGASGVAPENTLRAFREALAQGADGLEVDVQRAVDGALVLIHDDTVERTTNGTGNVGDMTLAALRALDAGDGEAIPSLDELLTWAAAQSPAPFLNLELKMPGVGPDTLAALAVSGYAGPVALSSFDYPSLEETRRLDAVVELWVLAAGWDEGLIDRARAIGATCLDLRHGAITAEVAAQVADAGLGLVAWTVNDAPDIRRLLALEPAPRALIGNYPDRLRVGRDG